MQPGSWQSGAQKEPGQALEETGQHLPFFKMHRLFKPAVPYQGFTPQIPPPPHVLSVTAKKSEMATCPCHPKGISH